MKIAVMGTGGVGGYFGGRLAQSGQDVTFIARGEHLAAIQRKGLRVQSIDGDFSLPEAKATDSPATVWPVDVLLVCVKTWQLAEAVVAAKPLVGAQTSVLPLLNGVEAYDQIKKRLPQGIILAGLARIVSYIAEPGVIHHESVKPYIGLGSFDGRHSDRVAAVHKALVAAGIDAETPDDMKAALWAKFLFVCAWGAVGALSRASIGVIRSEPETRKLILNAMAEIREVALSHDVDLPEDLIDRSMAFIDKMAPQSTTSLQRDIIEGRPSELDAWSGAVVRLGRQAGVATPVHHTVYAGLLPLEKEASGRLAPGKGRPQ